MKKAAPRVISTSMYGVRQRDAVVEAGVSRRRSMAKPQEKRTLPRRSMSEQNS
jgi:hypothetical protein